MTQKPPRYSLVSANGPSVVTVCAVLDRTTVAVSSGCSPQAKTQWPSACSSRVEGVDVGEHLLICFGGRLGLALGAVDGQQVLSAIGLGPFRWDSWT